MLNVLSQELQGTLTTTFILSYLKDFMDVGQHTY